jgi:hypothetical protein
MNALFAGLESKAPGFGLFLAAGAFLAGACGTGDVEANSFSVRDSAGVQLVESARPSLADDAGWTVDAAPYLTIGQVDGEAPYLLNRVGRVQVMPDGRVLVVNNGDMTLRVFTPEGTFDFQSGGRGDGPGEFRGIGDVWVRNGEIIAHPASHGAPVNVFDLEGNLLRSYRVQGTPTDYATQTRGLFADGSGLGFGAPHPPDAPTLGGVSTVHGALFLIAADGSRMDSIGAVEHTSSVNVGDLGMYPMRFSRWGFVAAGDSVAYLGWNGAPEIKVISRSGALLRIQRWALPEIPVTREQIEIYKDEGVPKVDSRGNPVSAANQARYQAIVDAMAHPDKQGLFREMLVDAAGYLWTWRIDPDYYLTAAQREAVAAKPSVWDVFDQEGVWVDVVEVPAGLTVSSVGHDHVAVIARDALGVERVQLHRLSRAGRGS